MANFLPNHWPHHEFCTCLWTGKSWMMHVSRLKQTRGKAFKEKEHIFIGWLDGPRKSGRMIPEWP